MDDGELVKSGILAASSMHVGDCAKPDRPRCSERFAAGGSKVDSSRVVVLDTILETHCFVFTG